MLLSCRSFASQLRAWLAPKAFRFSKVPPGILAPFLMVRCLFGIVPRNLAAMVAPRFLDQARLTEEVGAFYGTFFIGCFKDETLSKISMVLDNRALLQPKLCGVRLNPSAPTTGRNVPALCGRLSPSAAADRNLRDIRPRFMSSCLHLCPGGFLNDPALAR